jgi:glycosyltransferase involved in cell wall biosynthesis
VIESLAAGCPVIATPVGGVTDIISDGTNGLLVAVGDDEALAGAIHRLVADPALRERLGRQGRADVHARFHQGAVVAQLMDHYEQLAGERQPRT